MGSSKLRKLNAEVFESVLQFYFHLSPGKTNLMTLSTPLTPSVTSSVFHSLCDIAQDRLLSSTDSEARRS